MKKKILWILLDMVFLIIFNTIFYIVGGNEHPASVWISYGFIHFSYIMIIATAILIRKSSRSVVFGFSLYSISYLYFFVEFVVGLVFIFLGSESYKTALLTQITIAGIYAILLLANMIANEHSADSVARYEEEISFVKESSSRLRLLIGKLKDKKLNKELERLYDLVYSSPSKSIASVKGIEADVRNSIFDLEGAVCKEDIANSIDICKKIIILVEERNNILKASH